MLRPSISTGAAIARRQRLQIELAELRPLGHHHDRIGIARAIERRSAVLDLQRGVLGCGTHPSRSGRTR